MAFNFFKLSLLLVVVRWAGASTGDVVARSSTMKMVESSDFPKLYWINTNASVVRRSYMEDHLRSLRIANTRVEGFSSVDLPELLFPSWYAPSRRNSHTLEMGCLASHLRAIKLGFDDHHTRFVVAEDDFTLYEKLNVTKLWELAPADAMILILGFTTERGLAARWEKLKRRHLPWTKWTRHDPVWGTLMYSISSHGAKNLLEKVSCTPSTYNLRGLPAPHLVADFVLYSTLKTYVFGFPFVKHMGVGGEQWKSLIHKGHSKIHKKAMSTVERIRKELFSSDTWTQQYIANLVTG